MLKLEARTRLVAAEAAVAVASLEEPDRVIRIEEADISAAEARLVTAAAAEATWSAAEGSRLDKAEAGGLLTTSTRPTLDLLLLGAV